MTAPADPALLDDRTAILDRALVSAFLENIPDFVFFKDRASRFLVVSQSVVRHFGAASSAQVVGRTAADYFSAAYAGQVRKEEERIIRTGESLLDQLERETWTDGRVTWALTSRMPLRNEDGEIIGTFGLSRDVTKTREMELALEKARKDLVDASRVAGMAEVATGVLHNVGNVLNSLNVSASVLAAGLRQSKADSLARVAALLEEHQDCLGEFLTHDPKGRRIPEFIESLARHAMDERVRFKREIASLQRNIDHIKEIVSMQQAYATMIGVIEPLDPVAMMEDSLRMNAGALEQHEVRVDRAFVSSPLILAEKAKVLQVLVNLIRNAKHACQEHASADKRILLRIEPAPTVGRVRLMVQDNGVGIPAENLTRIFAHGFTTRANGHGFGLHSAANAAREMNGSLAVQSDGPGKGAIFILELPAAPRDSGLA